MSTDIVKASKGALSIPFVGSAAGSLGRVAAVDGGILAISCADRVAERTGRAKPSKALAGVAIAAALVGKGKTRKAAEDGLIIATAPYMVDAGRKAGDAIVDTMGLPAANAPGGDAE